MPRKDPFKTLDDPEPAPAAAPAVSPDCSVRSEKISAGSITAATIADAGIVAPQWLKFGALCIPLRRPGWWRRLIVRLVLGWRYE